ncbi:MULTISPECIES: hypothetical protein [unclassified Mycobacterium]|uniref:hypothetical protein n=1 Tax=unclassified Mycobacterium TaxID=2642494 RepID=UPI000B3131E1|nr:MULTISPECIES: hypothetical protein [unclassified Mycobacterium]
MQSKLDVDESLAEASGGWITALTLGKMQRWFITRVLANEKLSAYLVDSALR